MNIKTGQELSRVVALHKTAEKFDPKTEEVFKYLQVFTAICDAFSHGANDVANAVGPLAAIVVAIFNFFICHLRNFMTFCMIFDDFI